MSDIAIPIPKGYKLIIVVSDTSSMVEINDMMHVVKEFNASNDSALIVREGLIKQIYLVEKVELKS